MDCSLDTVFKSFLKPLVDHWVYTLQWCNVGVSYIPVLHQCMGPHLNFLDFQYTMVFWYTFGIACVEASLQSKIHLIQNHQRVGLVQNPLNSDWTGCESN